MQGVYCNVYEKEIVVSESIKCNCYMYEHYVSRAPIKVGALPFNMSNIIYGIIYCVFAFAPIMFLYFMRLTMLWHHIS